MAGRGGYQPPAHPAPVSGPGALSRRTDTGVSDSRAMVRPVTGGAYGDGVDFAAIQSGAPLGAASSANGATPLTPEDAGLSGFDAPSARPDEPVTSGAALGPGPGVEKLGGPNAGQELMEQTAQQLAASIPVLEKLVNRSDDPALRAVLMRVKARL